MKAHVCVMELVTRPVPRHSMLHTEELEIGLRMRLVITQCLPVGYTINSYTSYSAICGEHWLVKF